MNVKEKNAQYVVNSYGRFPLEIVSGKGSVVFDENGKEYIDLGTGIAVNSFGVADDIWKAAVTEQINKVQHMSNLYYTAPSAELAELLCAKTGMKKVFFGNSGAEANECAIKAARRWAFQKYGDGSHSTIITLKNSFHGRTITTLAATGQDSFHTEFGPFTEGFVYADPTDASDVERLASENKCAAVMIEVVQGEGGIYKLTQEFVDGIKKTAGKHDLLIIVDEVQTGNGRTGKFYGYMHYGLEPDIVSTAKGLAGGLPIGATLFGERTADVLTPGSHGSTFGGNPVSCAAAVSIVKRIDAGLLEEVKAKSDYIVKRLAGTPGVKSVSGLGLMLGIETEKPAKEVIAACMEKGVLVLSAKNKVRLLPALNIPQDKLQKAIDILTEVIAQ